MYTSSSSTTGAELTGKPRSFHLSCRATDFSVAGDAGGVLDYLRSLPEVGGYARYPQGFFHIDTGPRRTW